MAGLAAHFARGAVPIRAAGQWRIAILVIGGRLPLSGISVRPLVIRRHCDA